MINFLAQTESRGAASILESAPTDEIMVMCVVFIVFSTLLLVVVTYCVTSTVRAIRIAEHSGATDREAGAARGAA